MRPISHVLLCGAALAAGIVAQPAAAAPVLERTAMLMRHGIRPPTKAQPIDAALSDKPWPRWSTAPGLLTERGAAGAALLGAADRVYLARTGLLPARGCPAAGTVRIYASAKQRAIRTAEAWAGTALPGCGVTVEHPAADGPDLIFHGLDQKPVDFDGHRAWREGVAAAPPGGVAAEARAAAGEIALLAKVLGCAPPACDLQAMPTVLVEEPHDRPEMTGPLDIGSTASQSLLLEYLEGMPMAEVGWGRVTRSEIERLLRFHPIKFRYANRLPYVARATAAPLIMTMLGALAASSRDGRVTLLTGHDTNIADLAGLLDLHWHVASYPADDTPPGGAIGFELWRAGKARYVRAFYRAQTMDQLRALTPIDRGAGPVRQYLDIPGCGAAARPARCTLARFERLIRAKLAPTS